jgi:hypothetical protein
MIQSIHTAVLGRARYKVEELYRSESLKLHLEARLVAFDSIHAVSASALTGNILVHFDPARSAADIMVLLDGVVAEHRGKRANDAQGHFHTSPDSADDQVESASDPHHSGADESPGNERKICHDKLLSQA